MKTQLSRWGNSLALRIPKNVVSAAKLKAGDSIELSVDGPGVVKLQKREKKLTLKDLVEGINADNVHAEIDWTGLRENEVW